MLPDAQLSSWARIALEAIPDAEADQALRAAATKLDGRLLVGMLNSLGVRRDDESVELLASKLEAEDAEVASAAAVALGMIGNDAAATALGSALADAPPAVRSAVAEGYVLCASAAWRRTIPKKQLRFTMPFAKQMFLANAYLKRHAGPFWLAARQACLCYWSNFNPQKKPCFYSRWVPPASFQATSSMQHWLPN